ncbi:hypothetical protein ES703_92886 [subsurface metagenome]
MIELGGIKRVLVNGQPYMSWESKDEASQRMAVVQLYKSGLGTQADLARIFGLHVNSVQRYITDFKRGGLQYLISQRSGPRQRWKLIPRLRSKILFIALKEGILEYEAIKKRLEEWNEHVSIPSIRQVLLENGLINEQINVLDALTNHQRELFFGIQNEKQLYLDFGGDTKSEELIPEGKIQKMEKAIEVREVNVYLGDETSARRYYSQAQRIYLDQLEQGYYNAYAGGLLFAHLLERYSFLPTIRQVITIPPYEGYSLEELCLTLFYFDVFGFRSMEDFKKVYREEFGVLIGRSSSPSHFTLRRFLHRIRELNKSEELIEEYAFEYLKSGIARWGVLYIDGHFLPYYGLYTITKGWCMGCGKYR